jgi:hypothetical protein
MLVDSMIGKVLKIVLGIQISEQSISICVVPNNLSLAPFRTRAKQFIAIYSRYFRK